MLKDSSHICESCLRVFSKLKNQENKLCSICEDDTRDSKSLMIVVKELDIDAIEKTGFYHGKYFVLGSVLPFLTEKPTDILNIRELVNLIHSNLQNGDKNISEIIFALPATDEGENTINSFVIFSSPQKYHISIKRHPEEILIICILILLKIKIKLNYSLQYLNIFLNL